MSSFLGSRELPDWPVEPDPKILRDLVDTHAHPTDYKRFLEDKEDYRDKTALLSLDKVCAMSSHLKDQDLVRQLVEEHSDKIVPAFGLHPWWSHHISFEEESKALDKFEHYRSIFPTYLTNAQDLSEEASSLFESFPEPTHFSKFLRETLRPNLEAHPQAMLGEVGLDRSFRIPYPQTDSKSNRSEQRLAKKFTDLKVPTEHQLKLLESQMEVAFELGRNVSMHSVQAVGAMTDLLLALPKKSKGWPKSRSKICLHSYGGSTDVIERISKHIDPHRIYFSFSTTINARLERLEELIRTVPDDRLLIESDFNDIRHNEARIWEILGIVCAAKGWTASQAAYQLKSNWEEFSR